MLDQSLSQKVPPVIRSILFDRVNESDLTVRMGNILQRWIRYADETFAIWPERENCGHFFGGSYWYELETAYTAMVYAVVGKVGQYDEELTTLPRQALITKAVQALRYLCYTHDTGPEECVRIQGRNPHCSGRKWGGRGDNFFMASQTGTSINAIGYTAWLLWEDMDTETKSMIEQVLVYYADKWSDELPRNGVYFNTQCEENGWTAAGIGAAAALFPEHPNNERWKNAANGWAVNSVSTVLDNTVRRPAVSTVTFHPDFTSENHAFVHPSYMLAGISLRGYYAASFIMSGEEIPEELILNNAAMYNRTIKKWSMLDGYPIPVQGQDWWYNRQHEALMGHAFMNVVHQDADAALLELRALEYIERIQTSNSRGCLLEENGEECIVVASSFQTAVDMEFASAHSVVTAYILHLFGGNGAIPTAPEVFTANVNGVNYYPYGSIVTHRTKDTFSSFSWRSHVMALTLPRHSMWSITPLYTSYTGNVVFEDELPSPTHNESMTLATAKESVHTYEDGFGVTALIQRGSNQQLNQHIGFLSLPNGYSVYVEQMEAAADCRISSLCTGLIGVRNEKYSDLPAVASGTKLVQSANEAVRFPGFYGKEANATHSFEPSPFINVNNEIGYVIFGSQGITYLNQHEYPKWKGVEDVLTLNEYQSGEYPAGERLQPFVVVTVPNSSVEHTSTIASQTELLSVNLDKCVTVEIANYMVVSYNGDRTAPYAASKSYLADAALTLFEGRQTLANNTVTRYGTASPGDAYYTKSKYSLVLLMKSGNVLSPVGTTLEVIVADDRVIVINDSDQTIEYTVTNSETGNAETAEIKVGLTQVHRFT